MHLIKEIAQLKKRLLSLGAEVEESVILALKALRNRDTELAQAVLDNDEHIDRVEVEVEEECLKILALHQPVAIDLRFIIAILKMNNDLERIGDLAVNISQRAAYLAGKDIFEYPPHLFEIADRAKEMLSQGLDSLINLNLREAHQVCRDDDEVDRLHREIYVYINEMMQEHPEHIKKLIQILEISHHLERIADLATNLAEDVIYMIEGKIIRHHGEGFDD
ncbi:phosphate signaling complex protein PhoU [bacterium]|nr:phosphate signaling complex protein PhoU [candidate division CSSED10-310 bacterium]